MTTTKAAPKPVAAAPAKKVPANSNKKHEFKTNDHVVYPTHGVGKVSGIEEKEVAGLKLELFIIEFEKDKMTLRVPTLKAKAVGMRKLSSPEVVGNALNTLKGRARICPYYFVKDDRVSLGGVLVTLVPTDKKLIHGMRDAIISPAIAA